MIIEQLMSKHLITLELDDHLYKAKKTFEEHNIHHIIIVDEDGKLSGVINNTDMYKFLSPNIGTNKETHNEVSMLQKKIHQIMARDVVTANKSDSIHQAILTFYDHHISCLPIVDDELKPIGIITWRDIIKVIALQYRQKSAAKNLKST